MSDLKIKNKELLKEYDGATNVAIAHFVDIENKKINQITFSPFEGVEIQRLYGQYQACQVAETDDGVDIYIEPKEPSPDLDIIFIKDICEKGIKKVGHFTQHDYPVVATCKYRGALTKEKVIEAREKFEIKYPEIKKLEQEGKISILALAMAPKDPTHQEYKTDCYSKLRLPTFELEENIIHKKKMKP